MPVTTETPVGQIAANHPLATRVFARHKIDFCCGGGLPLQEACAKKGIDASTIVAEIEKELATKNDSDVRWDEKPLDELIDHILSAYHRPLDEELPRLEAMARKVSQVHHDKDPQRLSEMLKVFLELKAELQQHMAKEEQILFPMIRQGQGAMAGAPVSMMMQEHDAAGEALRQLRSLTDDYTPPAEACNTWRALWHGLGDLETQMHQHIHLENNILFPRALAG